MKTNMICNFFKVCCLLLACSALWCGCEREYLWYDAEQKDGLRLLPWKGDTTVISTQSLDKWVTYREKVDIVGFARDVNRRFKVEIVDSLTTIPADRFSFEDTCYIPANETYGWLDFSYAYSEEDTLSLGFRIVENDNFRPVMISQICFILNPYKPGEPDWWMAGQYMFGSPWTPRLYELFLQFYHAVEQDNPYVWTTFLEPNLGRDCGDVIYGEHWSKPWGKPYQWNPPYDNLLRRFVAQPLYDHLQAHPEDCPENFYMPDPYN